MKRFIILVMLVFFGFNQQEASAIFLAVGDANPGSPADITFQPSQNSTLQQSIAAVNTAASNAYLQGWQLDIHLHGLAGSQGQLNFTSVNAPADALFGILAAPNSIPAPPSKDILASDAYLLDFENGALLSSGGRGSLVTLSIEASPGTSGDFEIVTSAFDPLGTSWISAGELDPLPFENTIAGSMEGSLLLGTIHVASASLVGDYNQDHSVDQLDYQRWYQDFAKTVSTPGTGADGNLDGVVDAADYVVWRKAAAAASGSGAFVATSAVPEPSMGWLSLLWAACFVPFARRRKLSAET